METVLVIGGSSLLGKKMVTNFPKSYKIIPTYNSTLIPKGIKLNIGNRKETEQLLKKYEPDVVVLLAGYTDVDLCEKNQDWAWELNVESSGSILDYCNTEGVKLIYPSSDYVFFGSHRPYSVDSLRRPRSFYGRTKKEMEDRITRKLDDFLILRMDKLYGYNDCQSNDTFTMAIVEKLKNNERIKLDCRQIRYPTLVDDIANFVKESIKVDRKGICHIPGPERHTKFSWGKTISEIFELDDSLLLPFEENKPNRPKDVNMVPYPGIEFHNLKKGLEIMKKQIYETI